MTDAEDFEGSSRLDDFVVLFDAATPEELHRRLVLHPARLGKSADSFEPWCLLQHVHKDRHEGSATTALLLLTDARWRSATGRLARQIADSDLVPDEHLDLLARSFIAADSHVFWWAPAAWFDGPEIVIDLATSQDANANADEGDAEDPTDLDDDRPVVVRRAVCPALRRWAAARVTRAEPEAWSALLARARGLDARSAAAIVRGILDARDALAPRAQEVLLALASDWPQRGVREAAHAATTAIDSTSSPASQNEPSLPKRAGGEPTLF